MYDFFVKHFDKISLFLKEPVFYVLIVVVFMLGMKLFHTMHNAELRELQLKAERLEALEEKFKDEIRILDEAQIRLLKNIYNFQVKTPDNKVILARDGFIFDDQARKPTSINLVRQVLNKEPDEQSLRELDELILSIPNEFMKLIPEMRWDSPYVIVVTSEGVKKLQEEE